LQLGHLGRVSLLERQREMSSRKLSCDDEEIRFCLAMVGSFIPIETLTYVLVLGSPMFASEWFGCGLSSHATLILALHCRVQIND
jgi:hypothetical protein